MGFIKQSILIIFLCLSLSTFATKRALLIGISDYPAVRHTGAGWAKIHGANDVYMLRLNLKKQGFKVTTLIDEKATASRIRRAFEKIQIEAAPGDLIYIHFSCHGQPVEDYNGDEDDGWDEAIIPYDAYQIPVKGVYSGKNHIIDDELNLCFCKLRKKIGSTGFLYVVVDACHSGGIDRGEEYEEEEEVFVRGTKTGFSLSNKSYVPRLDTRANIPIKSEKGMAETCMLEACRAYQSNYEFKQNGTYYGPLSFYVNKVLMRHKLSSDDSWVKDVKKLMDNNPKLVRQNMVIQTTKKK